MTAIVSLLIGNETWKLLERSLRSLRTFHPEQAVIVYYSLEPTHSDILEALESLGVEAVDIGMPGMLRFLPPTQYSEYNTTEFNIKTSFKWLAMMAAMTRKLDHVIFLDADIKIISELPFSIFEEIWEHYDIFVQDEGNMILPKHPCTGFIGFKFCDANISLLEHLHRIHCAALVSDQSQHDQSIFAGYVIGNIDTYKRIYFLPQLLFPVGYMGPIYAGFNNQRVTLRGQSDPVIYHANWAVGIEAKASLMDAFDGAAKGSDDDSGKPISHKVGNFLISLPPYHLLPVYQSAHPNYDRFLLYLANVLPPEGIVIDVGANCGDSLAAMASSNHSLRYICIEADKDFFLFLQQNVNAMREVCPALSVDAVCALVSSTLKHAVLEGSGGTKKASIATEQAEALAGETLDSIAMRMLDNTEKIILIKTDTDGWDSDVISSATSIIEGHLPLLFIECQHSNAKELQGLIDMFDWLYELGYRSWFVFDNFGGYLFEASSPSELICLLKYVERQNSGVASRTIHYLDILAATPALRPLANSAIETFVSERVPKGASRMA